MALKEYYPEPENNIWYRLLKIIALLVFMAAFLGGIYWISRLNSGNSDNARSFFKQEPKVADPQMLEKSRALVAKYEETKHQREVNAEDIALLGEAVKLREAYFNQTSFTTVNDRTETEALKRRWHDACAEPMRKEAEAFAAQALVEEQAGAYEAALALMTKARDAIQRINKDYGLSRHASVELYSRYERRVREFEVIPTHKKSLELEQEAIAAEKAEQWVRAEELMREAFVLQHQIVNKYMDMPQSDVARMKRLEQLLNSYVSLEHYQKVIKLIESAESAERSRNWVQASEFFEQARNEQQTLNEKYPGSRFSDSKRVDSLGRKAETALSRGDAIPIIEALAKLDKALRLRNVQQVTAEVADVLTKTDAFRRRYVRSDALPENTYERLAFLHAVSGELDTIYKRLGKGLKPSKQRGVYVYGQLVEQSLFRLLTGANPSWKRAEEEPVESVNSADIELFNQRLGWLLLCKVRLPSTEEIENGLKGASEQQRITVREGMGEWVQLDATTYGTAEVAVNGRLDWGRKQAMERGRAVGFRFVIENS